MPEEKTETVVRRASALVTRVLADTATNVAYRKSSRVNDRLDYALSAYTRTPSESETALFDMLQVSTENSFDCLTQSKMNSVYALLCRILTPPNTKAWSIEATPDPQVPESVAADEYQKIFGEFIAMTQAQQQPFDPGEAVKYVMTRQGEVTEARLRWARERAKRMDAKVDDILLEGGMSEALQDFAHNLTVYGTGVIIGPTEQTVPCLELDHGDRPGKIGYRISKRKAMLFFVPETCDVYPSPGAKRPDQGNLVVKVSYEPHSLADFAMGSTKKGRVNGWDQDAVRRVLLRHPDGGLDVASILGDMHQRNMRRTPAPSAGGSGTIEGLRWFGSAPGKFLREIGVRKDFDDGDISEFAYYECDVILMDGEIVYAQVCDPVIGRPVFKTSFYGDSNVWFGAGLADVLAPVQALATICLSGLKKQVQMTSGPSVIFNDTKSFVNSGAPGYFSLSPWKAFMRKSDAFANAVSANAPAVQAVALPHTIRETLAVMAALDTMADDRSGFSRYLFGGGNFSGAARTAQGLTRIQESANIQADFVIANADVRVTSPLLRRVVAWLNYRGDDDTVKGDVAVVARGALGRALLSAQADSATAAFNAVMSGMLPQMLGPKRVLAMLEHYLEKTGFDGVMDVIGTKEQREFDEAMSQIRQMQQAVTGEQQIQAGEAEQAAAAEQAQTEARPGSVAERRGAA